MNQKGFNVQAKEHANNWGLNKNQLQLLSRRDNTKYDVHPYLNRAREGAIIIQKKIILYHGILNHGH
ncbi:hypothetical protein GL982_10335 (plasmid) [Spiroplasma citri]|uniref:hypothetical protein n=1 Tax=Spiroplasma citri TaxID=2133 RepID=UPI0009035328|nr:hypothetical protein [Spiroplasma citri]APE74686.1 hypothetical protein SCITRI_00793 [Spiroplasma citri]QIA73940.1 hypothetical protein GL982_10335 [Spiroplasma citri]QJU61572.1 hypothetical protein HHA36_03735 [Spiroplasma citri]